MDYATYLGLALVRFQDLGGLLRCNHLPKRSNVVQWVAVRCFEQGDVTSDLADETRRQLGLIRRTGETDFLKE